MESILLNQMTPQQLKELIADTVRAEMNALTKRSQVKAPEEWLTRDMAAEKLKINLSTLHKWTKKKRLNAYGMEGRVYYKNDEIDQALIKIN